MHDSPLAVFSFITDAQIRVTMIKSMKIVPPLMAWAIVAVCLSLDPEYPSPNLHNLPSCMMQGFPYSRQIPDLSVYKETPGSA